VERFDGLPGLSPEELLKRLDLVPYVQRLVEGDYERIRDAEEGERNQALLGAGKNLGELALCGWLGAEDIARLAIAAMAEEQHGWAWADSHGRADGLRALASGMVHAQGVMMGSQNEAVWVASHIHRAADWRCRSGDTLRSLLGVLIQASLAQGIDRVSMDMRTMAQLLGLGDHSSVRRHIKRLVVDGWVEVVSSRPGHPQAAVFYKLGQRLRQLARQDVEAALEHDLQQALERTSGPVDSRILRVNRTTRSTWEQLLAQGESSTEDLVNATGKGRRTIEGHLKELMMAGLAQKVRHGRYQATPVEVNR
jgi:DNA-binding transcriptional ArsR family regulator